MCCPLCYLLPCRNLVTPIRSIITFLMSLYAMCISIMLLVEVGRIELPSRTLFSSLHTAITFIILYIYLQGKFTFVFCPQFAKPINPIISFLNKYQRIFIINTHDDYKFTNRYSCSFFKRNSIC